MERSLQYILTHPLSKEEMISLMNRQPDLFEEAVAMALSDKHPEAWRAAWLLNHCMSENDPRIRQHINTMLDVIGSKKDGHQRELLRILVQMKADEDIEGEIFDVCMTIWESIHKIPSVRALAFGVLYKMAHKHPELKNELDFLTENHYIETLSPGIKGAILRMKKELRMNG